MGPTLRGLAYLASKDEPAARASFEKALKLRPDFPAALIALARLDLRANKPAAAEQRFQAALDKDAGDEAATLAYEGFLRAQKAPAASRKEVLKRLIQVNPGAVRGRVALIGTLIETGEVQDAVALAQQGLATTPDNPALLRAAGAAQIAARNHTEAVATYSKLAILQPQSPLPHLLIAYAYMAEADDRRALDALGRALRLKPDFLAAQLAAARVNIKVGNTTEALTIARDIQTQHPNAPVGYQMEAGILVKDKRWADADRVLKRGLEHAPNSSLAVSRYDALLVADRTQEAKQFANQWIAAHPTDVAFHAALGERAIAAGDYLEAARQYKAALSIVPDNVLLLNNVAWVSGKLKDPKALEYAERALVLAPNSPEVMDTLGWLLVEKGAFSRGAELLHKAVALSPEADNIRLNLARALLRSGDKAGARKELQVLASKGEKFSGQSEVRELLDSL
jgi:putative PEP-CTERM system TPR-repeat lipoprotein